MTNPLFTALAQKPQEARWHAPAPAASFLKFISAVTGQAVAKTVSNTILPSLEHTAKELAKIEKEAKEHLKEMHDTKRSKWNGLDRIAISGSDKPMSERKIIVYFLPNYELWQQKLAIFQELRLNLGVDVISSNYRGCGKSEGFPLDEKPLIDDGLAQVQQLLDQGAKPENIALYGYSLGGGISMAVAGLLEDNGVSVNVINERSFGSLSAVVKSMEVFGKELAAIGVNSLGWKLPSEEHLPKLKGRVVVIHNDYDELIEYNPSLKGSIDSKKPANMAKITCVAMSKTRTKSQHNRAWTAQETKAIYDAIRKIFVK
ncbi:MAG: alpha/beta hydrolase fold domain-containing protein [Verrucomicrobia bacterium]|nr:alpha/beta hydrolase fold domain-containing protein [Verrucomicrobiota bacterium]MBS0637114.1 alpha/beta hydrolase fold domain-containing protein [Verrucomicrobiota bacterium]